MKCYVNHYLFLLTKQFH